MAGGNKFEVELDQFKEVKQARNRAMSDPESDVTISFGLFT